MKERVLTGIGVLAVCSMFICMLMCVESTSVLSAVLSAAGVIASGAVAIYTSNSVVYGDDAE